MPWFKAPIEFHRMRGVRRMTRAWHEFLSDSFQLLRFKKHTMLGLAIRYSCNWVVPECRFLLTNRSCYAGSTPQAIPRPFQHPPSRSTLGPSRRELNTQPCSQPKQSHHKPTHKVAVVDGSEMTRIPVVNFNQRCRAQPAPPARAQTRPSYNPRGGVQGPSRFDQQVVERRSFLQRGAYGQYEEFVPQQRWIQPGQGGYRTDNLGLPEEWVY